MLFHHQQPQVLWWIQIPQQTVPVSFACTWQTANTLESDIACGRSVALQIYSEELFSSDSHYQYFLQCQQKTANELLIAYIKHELIWIKQQPQIYYRSIWVKQKLQLQQCCKGTYSHFSFSHLHWISIMIHEYLGHCVPSLLVDHPTQPWSDCSDFSL